MKRKLISNLHMNVGVMKDYKLRDLRASHTLIMNSRRPGPETGTGDRDRARVRTCGTMLAAVVD
jgi:hypothetical protein